MRGVGTLLPGILTPGMVASSSSSCLDMLCLLARIGYTIAWSFGRDSAATAGFQKDTRLKRVEGCKASAAVLSERTARYSKGLTWPKHSYPQ